MIRSPPQGIQSNIMRYGEMEYDETCNLENTIQIKNLDFTVDMRRVSDNVSTSVNFSALYGTTEYAKMSDFYFRCVVASRSGLILNFEDCEYYVDRCERE